MQVQKWNPSEFDWENEIITAFPRLLVIESW